jgi:two-component system cell cycle response regulator CpdR
VKADKVVVLIVEDEPIQSLELEELLTEGGYSVVVAFSGTEAIARIRSSELGIDGIVTDIKLGRGPDGWEVARHAREVDPTVSVLYVSGDSTVHWPSKGVPMSQALGKPYAPAQLITAISGLLNERSALS